MTPSTPTRTTNDVPRVPCGPWPTPQPASPSALAARSLALISWLSPDQHDVMRGWLRLAEQDDADPSPISLMAAVAVDRSRLTWTASGPIVSIYSAIIDIFSALHVNPDRTFTLAEVLEVLRPARLATWIELSPGGFDGGFAIHTPIDLSRALLWAPISPHRDRVAAWAAASDLELCTGLRGSVGEGAPFVDLRIPLWPSEPGNLWRVLDGVVDTLSARALAPLVPLVADVEPVRLSVALRLFAGGLARIGLVLADPEPSRIDVLCQETDAADPGEIRGILHALGESRPCQLEVAAVASGFDVALHASSSRR